MLAIFLFTSLVNAGECEQHHGQLTPYVADFQPVSRRATSEIWSDPRHRFQIEVTADFVRVIGQGNQPAIIALMRHAHAEVSFWVPGRAKCDITGSELFYGFDGITLHSP